MTDRGLYFEDVSVGDTGPDVTVADIGREEFVRYAGASGDFNPIHYDDQYAQEAGNPTIFGQGMLTAGILSRMVREWVGLGNLRSFSTRFQDRVWPGDTLRTTGEIVEKTPESTIVEGEVAVANQDDDTVITGTFTAQLPRRRD